MVSGRTPDEWDIVWASGEAISQIAQLPTIEKENPPFQLISTKAIAIY